VIGFPKVKKLSFDSMSSINPWFFKVNDFLKCLLTQVISADYQAKRETRLSLNSIGNKISR